MKRCIYRRCEGLDHLAFVRFRRVQFQTELTEPGLNQPVVNNLKSRHFFRDEQDRLVGSERLGD